MRKYVQVYSEICLFYDHQRKAYMKTYTILPVLNYSRIWFDFTSRHHWVWGRKRRIILLESPSIKFKERYAEY